MARMESECGTGEGFKLDGGQGFVDILLSLLEKTLAGKDATSMQRDQAANLRKKMLKVYNGFSTAIEKGDMAAAKKAVSKEAPFAGMLRWHLKNDYPDLFEQIMSPTPALEEMAVA